jgi:hypothetical protein
MGKSQGRRPEQGVRINHLLEIKNLFYLLADQSRLGSAYLKKLFESITTVWNVFKIALTNPMPFVSILGQIFVSAL